MSRPAVVCVHGLGGTPHSVLPLTAAAHAAGYTTVAPRLPGHGTNPDDLVDIDWSDWRHALDDLLDELSPRANGLVLVGQSMGATLSLQIAATRSDVVGVAAINAIVLPPDPDATEHLEHLISHGRTMQPAGDPDLRDPGAHDSAYAEIPLHALLQLGIGTTLTHELIPHITAPVMVVSSDHDQVVDPANSDALANALVGRVTRLRLGDSGHVAALDFDRDQLCRELLSWLARLTDESASSV